MRPHLLLAAALALLLVGHAQANQDDECRYGGCADYSPDIEFSGWDIFGPFVIGFLGVAFVVAILVIAFKAGPDDREETTGSDGDEEPEQP